MSAVTLLAAGLTVPAATFTGLWFWRLRPGRRRICGRPPKPCSPIWSPRLTPGSKNCGHRSRRLAATLRTGTAAWPRRWFGIIETAMKAAGIDPGAAAKRHGGQDGTGERGRGAT